MSGKILVNYSEDFGRMGVLEGMFICTQEELETLKGKEIYFGEVLGKHSDVVTDQVFESCTIKPMTKKQMETIIDVFGDGTISGYNPFDYVYEDEE